MDFNKENMPVHIAIIMDGNRRWAKKQGKSASYGHKEGAKTLENIVRYANKIGLEYITVYAFSVKILGDISALSEGMQKSIKKCTERTKDNTGVTFNIALNYGGRDEILKAVKQIAGKVKENKIEPEDITEEMISENLYTKDEPDPDLVIRTSGELRLSNFLPWQSVYSELLFIDKNWPDFKEEDLDNAIIEYQKRTRKFGAN